jgi:KDO2-lipid IV(A) lauroyltransferase
MIALFRFLSRLPLPILHRLGALFGWLAYSLSASYRANFNANLSGALGASDAKRVRNMAIAAAGQSVVELSRVWCRSHEAAVADIVTVDGLPLLQAARDAGKGIVFLTPHLGCFDLAGQYLALHAPITTLYRAPRQPWLQQLMRDGRARGDKLKLAPADLSGVRRLISALRKGEAVGLLPDQAPGAGEGKWLPFFGRPAYTMTLAARLTETGATPLFCLVQRLPAGRGYHLSFHAPSVPLEGDTDARARLINKEIEALIRTRPEQYLWGYNRYKRPAGASAPPGADGLTAGDTTQ